MNVQGKTEPPRPCSHREEFWITVQLSGGSAAGGATRNSTGSMRLPDLCEDHAAMQQESPHDCHDCIEAQAGDLSRCSTHPTDLLLLRPSLLTSRERSCSSVRARSPSPATWRSAPRTSAARSAPAEPKPWSRGIAVVLQGSHRGRAAPVHHPPCRQIPGESTSGALRAIEKTNRMAGRR